MLQYKNLPKLEANKFEIDEIDEILLKDMRLKNIYNIHSPVSIDRLKLIKIQHYGFDQKIHQGEIIVLDSCSEAVRRIFVELFELQFPLEKVKLITEYNGDDQLSMADNNSVGHNLRPIAGSPNLSLHAYGTAIDINPVINPFIEFFPNDNLGTAKFHPKAGVKFANRRKNRLGKTNQSGMAEDVVHIFAKHGFYRWGGDWDSPIDYQHFEVGRTISELLVSMESEHSILFFELLVDYYRKFQVPIEDELVRFDSIKDVYFGDSDRFFEVVCRLVRGVILR